MVTRRSRAALDAWLEHVQKLLQGEDDTSKPDDEPLNERHGDAA